MFVRIARFEGSAENADQTIAQIREQTGQGPPPGLEGARRVMMLLDRQNNSGLGLTFFDSEDEMRRGDQALNEMTPQGGGTRTGVEFYEVGLDLDTA